MAILVYMAITTKITRKSYVGPEGQTFGQFEKTIEWAQQVCNGTACMDQLAMFPSEVWVKVSQSVPGLVSCELKQWGCIGALSINYLWLTSADGDSMAVVERPSRKNSVANAIKLNVFRRCVDG